MELINKYKVLFNLFESKEQEFKKFIVIDETENKKYELNQFLIKESTDNSNEILDLFGKEFKIIDYFYENANNSNSFYYFCIVSELPNLRNFLNNLNINESKMRLIKKIIKKINERLKKFDYNLIPKIIKPENIFFIYKDYKTKEFDIEINDKIFDVETDNYSAPEILKGDLKNQKSFLWSIGLILYELYTNKYIFESNDKNETEKNRKEGKIVKNIDDILLNELIKKLVQIDVEKRIDFNQYLNDDFFAQIIEIKLNINFDNEKIEILGNDFNKENINFILFIDEKETKYQQIFDYLKKGIHEIKIKINTNNLNCKSMFKNCKNIFEIQFKNFNNITDTSEMFLGCTSLEKINLNDFSTNNVKDMNNMFNNCSNLNNLDLSSFNTKNVTNMCGMFSGCSNLTNLNLSSFNTKNVTDMSGMFANCNNLLNIDLSNFNTKNVTNMRLMFYKCNSLSELDLNNFNTENVNNMNYMFFECSSLNKINVGEFNTKNVKEMIGMFCGCSNLKYLEINNFITENVKDMSYMFCNCSKIKNLDLSNFKTQNVTKMSYMFYNCSSLKKLNITNFNTSNVTNLDYMFYNCSSLINIEIPEFNTNKAIDMSYMFYRCLKLKKIYLTNYNEEKENCYLNRMFFKCTSLKELDFYNFFIHSSYDVSEMFVGCSNLIYVKLQEKNDKIFDLKNIINFRGTKVKFYN